PSSDLMVGETVIAIGNAYGYEHSVTVGIVSAIKRDVTLNKEISYKQLIQTDASINPGNSGGPLLNINGELIGVNVAIRAGAQGIGFAIPVDTMIRVAANMLSVRRRNGTWHGLTFRDQLDLRPGVPVRSVLVEGVEADGPAAEAGIRKGDVLLQVGELRVGCCLDVERGLLDRPTGKAMPVVLRRGTAEQQVGLGLQSAQRAGPVPDDLVWRKLGLRLEPVGPEAVWRPNQPLRGGL